MFSTKFNKLIRLTSASNNIEGCHLIFFRGVRGTRLKKLREMEETTKEKEERVPYEQVQYAISGGVKRVKKLLKDSATYGDLKGNEISGDPFLTGPYARNFKVPRDTFQGQGESAWEQGLKMRIDPNRTSVIMFPGQGTQFVGMCGNVDIMPRHVKSLYEIASGILNYDLLDLCQNGPREKLDQTIYCQPAVVVASLAALEKLRDTNGPLVDSCVSTAGFSVGEITALVFAGVLTFEDAIRLVKVRADAMQLACEMTPSGMATVIYGADSKLNYALNVAKEWCSREYKIEYPVCSVANFLFPHCKVVAGNIEAIQFLEMNYKDFNLRRVKRLPVSGAFHTGLMKGAAEPLKALLKNMTLHNPRMPVFSNFTGYRYHSIDEVKKLLVKQVHYPVRWEQVVQTIFQRAKDAEFPNTFECGPGSSLSTILKQVNAKAHSKCKNILPQPD